VIYSVACGKRLQSGFNLRQLLYHFIAAKHHIFLWIHRNIENFSPANKKSYVGVEHRNAWAVYNWMSVNYFTMHAEMIWRNVDHGGENNFMKFMLHTLRSHGIENWQIASAIWVRRWQGNVSKNIWNELGIFFAIYHINFKPYVCLKPIKKTYGDDRYQFNLTYLNMN
jgi:hypothetical protein